jgi:hypothetical protein
MKHVKMTLAITAIVAAAALATVTFAVPQQVMAYRHHHSNNSIKVDQQVNQANLCSTSSPPDLTTTRELLTQHPPGPSTLCINEGSNSADIGH